MSSWTDNSSANEGARPQPPNRLAHLYAAFARDKAGGATDATTFADAVDQHRLIETRRRVGAARLCQQGCHIAQFTEVVEFMD
ncbi:hypothetical protein ACWGH2_18405 [Streptomyces sp. NPDC054871]